MKTTKSMVILAAALLTAGGLVSCGEEPSTKPTTSEVTVDTTEIVAVATKLGKTLVEESVTDVALKAEESSKYVLEKKTVKFEEDETEYFYFMLKSAQGFSGTVTFTTIIEGDKAIAYNFVKGNEDNIGLEAAKKVEITAEKPYTKGAAVESGASAGMTLPAIGKALDCALEEASK